jgi:hypothetical protein
MPLLVSTNSGAAFVAVDLPPDSAGLGTIVFARDRFVAVGEAGRVLWSEDGLRWEKGFAGASKDLVDVTYGDGRWVAVGNDGAIATSEDGISFSGALSPTSAHLNGIAYGAAGFLAVGASGTVVSSVDGETWVQHQPRSADLLSVAFGNEWYVAVGTNGIVQVSSNGMSWSDSRPTSGTLRDICFVDGLFVALEWQRPQIPCIAYFSDDGISWTSSNLPAGSISLSHSDNSVWVATYGTGNVRTMGKLRLASQEIRLRLGRAPSGEATMDFEALSAGAYTVLSAPDLDSSAWETNAVLKRELRDEIHWTIPNDADRARFFRIRLD